MYLLLCLLVQALAASAHRKEKSAQCALQNSRDGGHLFVQLADPQLGMLNQFAKDDQKNDFTEEAKMAKGLADMAAKIDPKPTFFFLGGDMQNEWPNSGDGAEGERQRAEAKKLLADVQAANIPVVCTPGNHDVNDNPSATDLDNYQEWWTDTCYKSGKLQDYGYEKDTQGLAEKWQIDNVLYVQLDSQLYYTTGDSVSTARDLQTQFLKSAVGDDGSIQRIMVLTHIPPFVNEPTEGSGWANWNNAYGTRVNVLKVLEKSIPVVWVCGHFHTNVVNDKHDYHKIRVTSAAGTTMYWDESQGEMSPEDAAKVATIPIGPAFCKFIMKQQWDEPNGKCGGFDLNAKIQRMSPIEQRSGMRIFHVKADGSEVKDKWFTLEKLKNLLAANDQNPEKKGKLAWTDLELPPQ